MKTLTKKTVVFPNLRLFLTFPTTNDCTSFSFGVEWYIIPINKGIYYIYTNSNNMEKVCLECGEKLVGRSDKKFCSDFCRNAYNNNINKDSKNLIRNINNRLRKNWRILENLNPEQKTNTSRKKLIQEGFDFNYITSIYTTKAGKVYYFVYDQGYLPLENDYYALVKRD